MPKTLTEAFVTAQKMKIVNKTILEQFQPGKKYSDVEIRRICAIVPPQTQQAWLAATDVAGHMSSRLVSTTKARGPTLQEVDRAYKSWIDYTGPEGITQMDNAENLRAALEKYMGYATNDNQFIISTNYRDKRDRGDMANVRLLTQLICDLHSGQRSLDETKKIETRENMLTLIANIDVKWDTLGNALGGLSLISGANDVIGASAGEMTAKMVKAVEGGVVAVGATVYAANEARTDNRMARFVAFLSQQCQKFAKWIGETLHKLRGGDRETIIMVANAVLKIVFEFACKAAADQLAAGKDIVDGVSGLIKDAWTRSTISAQRTALVTVDGAFAVIRSGIVHGIALRQAVSAWKIAKGTASAAITATTAGAAGKIADLVLAGFEFAFKMLYNFFEDKRIQDFKLEAKKMWQTLGHSRGFLPPPLQRGTQAASAPVALPTKPAPTGSMVKFTAESYTIEEFLNDRKGAYLHFLDAMVKASPLMAAIVMNSGLIASVEDVLHAATPRSTDDVDRAYNHIVTLQVEASRLFLESGFSVVSPTVDALPSGAKETYERLALNAKTGSVLSAKPTLLRRSA